MKARISRAVTRLKKNSQRMNSNRERKPPPYLAVVGLLMVEVNLSL